MTLPHQAMMLYDDVLARYHYSTTKPRPCCHTISNDSAAAKHCEVMIQQNDITTDLKTPFQRGTERKDTEPAICIASLSLSISSSVELNNIEFSGVVPICVESEFALILLKDFFHKREKSLPVSKTERVKEKCLKSYSL